MSTDRVRDGSPPPNVVERSPTYLFALAVTRTLWLIVSTIYAVGAYLLWCGVFFLPLRFTSWSSLYWSINAFLFRYLQSIVASWMMTAGYTLCEVGEDISECDRDECLLLVNHQSTGDVPTVMYSLMGKPAATGRVLWIIDAVFRYTFFGICSMLRGDFFIHSGKTKRERQLEQLKTHIEEVYSSHHQSWVILFPEGGFLRKRKVKSQLYARKNNYPELDRVTLPRLGALQILMNLLSPHRRNGYRLANGHKWRPLKWVIDVTIGYADRKPLDAFNITFGNRAPCETTLHYRMYPADGVPLDSYQLQTWLFQRYEEKDELLRVFYETGRFPVSEQSQCHGRVIAQPEPLRLSPWWLASVHIFFIVSLVVQCYAIRGALHWLTDVVFLV